MLFGLSPFLRDTNEFDVHPLCAGVLECTKNLLSCNVCNTLDSLTKVNTGHRESPPSGLFCYSSHMRKENLVRQLEIRRQWACNDCRTFLFAKSQLGWRDHETLLGGGNMAKPLILFAFWDVMAGIHAHFLPADERLIWTSEDEKAVESLRESFSMAKRTWLDERSIGDLSNEEKRSLQWQQKSLRFNRLEVGDIIDPPKALQLFLVAFQDHIHIGAAPAEFAQQIRPRFRNKLAHMYAPKLNDGASSSSPQPLFFDALLHSIANEAAIEKS